jgi:hypothetical protein
MNRPKRPVHAYVLEGSVVFSADGCTPKALLIQRLSPHIIEFGSMGQFKWCNIFDNNMLIIYNITEVKVDHQAFYG